MSKLHEYFTTLNPFSFIAGSLTAAALGVFSLNSIIHNSTKFTEAIIQKENYEPIARKYTIEAKNNGTNYILDIRFREGLTVENPTLNTLEAFLKEGDKISFPTKVGIMNRFNNQNLGFAYTDEIKKE